MALSIGIVGLPNVGKSTLFNALTDAGVLAANYPFATIEPNTGVVPIPDPRLEVLARIFDSTRVIPATVTFVDIAGLVKGASEGEGLGNQFLANIRDANAICHVVRGFSSQSVAHVDNELDQSRDIETIETELAIADLQTIDKRLPRLEKESTLDRSLVPRVDLLRDLRSVVASGRVVSSVPAMMTRASEFADLHLLTAKPVIYVFNLDEAGLRDEDLRGRLSALVAPSESLFVDAQIEAEMGELDEGDRRELLASVGQDEPGLECGDPGRLSHPRIAELSNRWREGSPCLDHPFRGDRPGGGRRHPYRFPTWIHRRRGGGLSGLGRVRVLGGGEDEGPGQDRGQGLRDAPERRGRVPLQRLIPGRPTARRSDSRVRRNRLRPAGPQSLGRKRWPVNYTDEAIDAEWESPWPAGAPKGQLLPGNSQALGPFGRGIAEGNDSGGGHCTLRREMPNPNERFVDRHIGPGPDDIDKMLATIGAASLDDLVAETIPRSIIDTDLDLPPALSEGETIEKLRELASKNMVMTSLIGLGYHDTITPACDSAQRAGESGLVHGVHAVPARDITGSARGPAQFPDDGGRPHRYGRRQRLTAR